MILETKSSRGGVSIILAGPSLSELTKIKKTLKLILFLARNLWLEKDIIYSNY